MSTLGHIARMMSFGILAVMSNRTEAAGELPDAFRDPGSVASGAAFRNTEAMAQLQHGAEQGNPIAQQLLGFAYLRGWGVPCDYFEARKWNQKAADNGNSGGHVNLAFLYASGRGGPKSFLLAYKHYFLAAMCGSKRDNCNRALWYALDPMARNPALSLMFCLVAALQGHPVCIALTLLYLGCIFGLLKLLRWIFRRLFPPPARQGQQPVLLSSPQTFLYKFFGSAFGVAMLICLGVLISLGALQDDGIFKEIFGVTALPVTFFSAIAMAFVVGKLFEIKKVEVVGDALRVSNFVDSVTIPLRNITEVSGSLLVNPAFVWFELSRPTLFGTKIVFMPPSRLLNWGQHPAVRQLRERVAAEQVLGNEATR